MLVKVGKYCKQSTSSSKCIYSYLRGNREFFGVFTNQKKVDWTVAKNSGIRVGRVFISADHRKLQLTKVWDWTISVRLIQHPYKVAPYQIQMEL